LLFSYSCKRCFLPPASRVATISLSLRYPNDTHSFLSEQITRRWVFGVLQVSCTCILGDCRIILEMGIGKYGLCFGECAYMVCLWNHGYRAFGFESILSEFCARFSPLSRTHEVARHRSTGGVWLSTMSGEDFGEGIMSVRSLASCTSIHNFNFVLI